MPHQHTSARRPSPPRPKRRPSAGPTPDAAPPNALLDALHDALDRAVTALQTECPDVRVASLSDADADGSGSTSSTAHRPGAAWTETLQVDGPHRSVRVHFSGSPLHPAPTPDAPAPYTVKVGIESGPLVRYTTRASGSTPAGASPEAAPLTTLGHKAETFLRRELRRRLDLSSTTTAPPQITLDAEGRIQALSPAARTALEYAPDDSPTPNFFSHVAGCSLRQVLRDLGRMVNGDCRRAEWLVRLRTGTGRWRWYRAVATSQLASSDAITVNVWPLGPVVPPRGKRVPREQALNS